MYEIIYSEKAIDAINRQSKSIRDRIYRKLDSVMQNPFHFFEKLSQRNEFKLRVGDYRVIAEINQSIKIIFIHNVGHRKNIYENI